MIYYEDRDHIIVGILDLIEKKLSKKKIELEEDFWDDILGQIDELFEPYADGWRNYN